VEHDHQLDGDDFRAMGCLASYWAPRMLWDVQSHRSLPRRLPKTIAARLDLDRPGADAADYPECLSAGVWRSRGAATAAAE
jgi:hypothetical protein